MHNSSKFLFFYDCQQKFQPQKLLKRVADQQSNGIEQGFFKCVYQKEYKTKKRHL